MATLDPDVCIERHNEDKSMDTAYAASYHKDHDLFEQHRKMELSGIELEILLQFGRNSHQFAKF